MFCKFFQRSAVLGVFASLLFGLRAEAMTYVPMSDGDLFDGAPLVVSGAVTAALATPGHALDSSDYTIAVDEVIKGDAQGRTLTVRVPGALDQTQRGALVVPGAPRLREGEKALLFLSPRSDGSYDIYQLALGRFSYAETAQGESLWERDVSEAEVAGGGDDPYSAQHRNAPQFMDWMRDRARGASTASNYWSTAAGLMRGKYNLTTPLARWFQFDRGESVPIYASSTALTGVSSGGYSELQAAIKAWNDDPGSNIKLSYAGTSGASSGLANADGVSEVLFNDPNNEIAGAFDCLKGGIGALGQWRSLGTQTYKGQSFGIITEGDIVVQDNISCLLNLKGKGNGAEILAHELGHVLGLAHSCGDATMPACTSGSAADAALMRPTLHGDGRGASLSDDDRAAVAYLYDAASSGGTSSGSGSSSASAASTGGGALDASMLVLLLIAALGALAGSRALPRFQWKPRGGSR